MPRTWMERCVLLRNQWFPLWDASREDQPRRRQPPQELAVNRWISWTISFVVLALVSCAGEPPDSIAGQRTGLVTAFSYTAQVGAIPDSLNVSPDGQPNYAVAFQLPPGRRGIQPALGLVYGGGDHVGTVGLGFGLSGLSSITRCSKTIAQDFETEAPRLEADDAYCLDGARMIEVAGIPGEYRTRRESFRRIVSHTTASHDGGPTSFTVQHADGQILTYGATTNSRQTPHLADGTVGPSPVVLAWFLDRLEDRDGNYYTVEYDQRPTWSLGELGPEWSFDEVVPRTIEYTGNGAVMPSRKVEFIYSLGVPQYRPASYIQGIRSWPTQRLDVVRVTVGQTPVSEYRLTYDQSLATGRELLSELEHCALTPSAACMPATTFAWDRGRELDQFIQPDFRSGELSRDTFEHPFHIAGDDEYSGSHWLRADASLVLDATGDGISDLLVVDDGTFFLHLGDRTPSESLATVVDMGDAALGLDITQMHVLDYNGDGRDDVLMVQQNLLGGNIQFPNWGTNQFVVFQSPEDGIGEFVQIDPGLEELKWLWVAITRSDPWAEGYFPTPVGGRYETVDFNGDGRLDIAYCEVQYGCAPEEKHDTFMTPRLGGGGSGGLRMCPSRLMVSFGLEGGFVPFVDTGVPIDCLVESSAQNGGQMFGQPMAVGDYDGDGAEDLMISFEMDGGIKATGMHRFVTYDGAGGFDAVDTNLVTILNGLSMSVDVNGDGLTDIIQYKYDSVSPASQWFSEIHLNTGNISATDRPPDEPGPDTKNYFVRLGDRTGPSRITNVFALTNTNRVYNTSSPSEKWTQIPLFPTVIDMNSDGYPDFVAPYWDTTYLGGNNTDVRNLGPDTVYTRDARISVQYGGSASGRIMLGVLTDHIFEGPKGWQVLGDPTVGSYSYWTGFDVRTVTGDFDGDGVQDIVEYDRITEDWATEPDLSAAPFVDDGTTFRTTPRLRYHRNTQGRFERLKRITDGVGSAAYFYYGPLTDPEIYTPSSECVLPQQCYVGGGYVVKWVYRDDGEDGFVKEVHSYADGRTDTARGWLGFAEHRVENLSTGRVETSYMDNHTFDAAAADYPFAQRASRVETLLGSDAVDPFGRGSLVLTASRRSRCQEVRVTPEGTWWVADTCSIAEEFTSSVHEAAPFDTLSPQSTVTRTYGYDEYGNRVFESVDLGDGYVEQISSPFIVDPTNWLLRLPEMETYIGDSNSCHLVRTKEFTWSTDGRGRLESLTMNKGTADELVASMSYDDFGNTTDVTVTGSVVDARASHYIFGPEGYFATQSTDALGHTRSTLMHDVFGTISETTDFNGNVTSYEYDGFGRPTRTVRPDATTYETNYFVSPEGGVGNYSYGTAARDGFNYRDRLGRVTMAGVAQGDGSWRVQSQVYDSLGQVQSTTEPYFWGSSPTAARTYEYDSLGIRRRVTGPMPATDTEMWVIDRTTYTRDERGAVRSRSVDLGGFVKASAEPLPGGTTTFEHCVNGSITRVEDPQGNVTTHGIDPIGRTYWSDDPNTGMTWLGYTPFNELAWQDNEEGENTQLQYDAAGRLTRRTSPDGVDNYYFDGPNGIGLPYYSVRGRSGTYVYMQYDSLSRETHRWHRVDGSWRGTSRRYDGRSRIDQVTYPSAFGGSFRVNRTYDEQNDLTEVSRDDTGAVIWSVTTDGGLQAVNARGQITQETFGNGAVTDRTYEDETGRLTSLHTSGSWWGTPVVYQDVELGYDDAGNLDSRMDLEEEATFGYDLNGHLEEYSRDGEVEHSYSWDSIGNMEFASDTGSMVHGLGPGTHAAGNQRLPHALTQTGSGSYGYDNVGRLLTDPSGRSVEWLANGRPERVTRGASSQTMDYDALDRRVARTVDGERTVYLEDVYELRTIGTSKEEVFHIAGRDREVAFAVRTSSGAPTMHYIHDDEMGSTNIITTTGGDTSANLSYEPFGARRDASWTMGEPPGGPGINSGYTGHEHDTAVGLINMRGRLYDPASRHFLSPDPVIAEPYSQSTYNAFGYVYGNPFAYTDPTGFTGEAVMPMPTVSQEVSFDNGTTWEDVPLARGVPHPATGLSDDGIGNRAGTPAGAFENPVVFIGRLTHPNGRAYQLPEGRSLVARATLLTHDDGDGGLLSPVRVDRVGGFAGMGGELRVTNDRSAQIEFLEDGFFVARVYSDPSLRSGLIRGGVLSIFENGRPVSGGIGMPLLGTVASSFSFSAVSLGDIFSSRTTALPPLPGLSKDALERVQGMLQYRDGHSGMRTPLRIVLSTEITKTWVWTPVVVDGLRTAERSRNGVSFRDRATSLPADSVAR